MIIFLVIFIIIILLKRGTQFTNVQQKIAIISLFYKPKNIETWLQLHRELGISHFYIRLEDTPELIDYLRSQPDVTLKVGTSSASNQYTSLIDRQIKTINDVLKLCKNDGINFLIHIDCDEILEGDLNEILNLPESVDTFWMQNFEAVYDHIPTNNDNCFEAKYFKDCGKPGSGCVSYVNGKGGVRVGKGVESDGPHRFKGILDEVKLNKVIVKHFESCDFEQYIKKYQRYQKGVKLTDIPFPYYRESILAKDNVELLKNIYKKYRVD